ncbi:MAG: hypothetical protein Q8Q23_03055 [bacterium]|nr:hypothetical protein [bacterium]
MKEKIAIGCFFMLVFIIISFIFFVPAITNENITKLQQSFFDFRDGKPIPIKDAWWINNTIYSVYKDPQQMFFYIFKDYDGEEMNALINEFNQMYSQTMVISASSSIFAQ